MHDPITEGRDTLANFESDVRKMMREQIEKTLTMDSFLQDTTVLNKTNRIE